MAHPLNAFDAIARSPAWICCCCALRSSQPPVSNHIFFSRLAASPNGQGPGPIAAVRHEVLTTTLEIALISCAGLATWAMGWKVAATEVKLGSEYAQHRTGNAAEEGPDTREAVFDKFGNRRLLLLGHPANPGRG
jgi:hypothetical protein